MIIKNYAAPYLEKALWLLNEDLGPGAVILKTRFNHTKNGSKKPLRFVEITAALDSSFYKRENPEHQHIKSSELNKSIFNFQKNTVTKNGKSQKAEIVEVIGW